MTNHADSEDILTDQEKNLKSDRLQIPQTHFTSCIGMHKGCDKRNLNFNSSSKHKKLTSAASRRPISTTRTDYPSGDMKYTELTEQTDPKVECLHLSKPAYHPQRSRDQRKLTRNTSPWISFSLTETWPSVTSTVRPTKQSISTFFNQTVKTGWL